MRLLWENSKTGRSLPVAFVQMKACWCLLLFLRHFAAKSDGDLRHVPGLEIDFAPRQVERVHSSSWFLAWSTIGSLKIDGQGWPATSAATAWQPALLIATMDSEAVRLVAVASACTH